MVQYDGCFGLQGCADTHKQDRKYILSPKRLFGSRAAKIDLQMN